MDYLHDYFSGFGIFDSFCTKTFRRYFYSLPYLLWRTPFPTLLRVFLFQGVELSWNVYPSNFYSFVLLLGLHLVILWGLWSSSTTENPYASDKSLSRKEK